MTYSSSIKKQQIKNFFNHSQITSESVQNNLGLYFTRIEQHLLVITHIQAQVLCQKEQVDPTFDTVIINVQKSYANIIQDQLIKTIDSAKNLHDATGAFGFVIGLLADTVNAMIKPAEIEQHLSTYLDQQEDHAALMKREELEHCFKQIEIREQAIDAIFNTTIQVIAMLEADRKINHAANTMIREVHYNSLQLSTTIKKTLREAIQNIEECINKRPLAIENVLPRQLMSNHLTRGTKSASVQTRNPAAYCKATIAHAYRKKQAREAYNHYLPVILSKDSFQKPSSLEIKCLTAVSKRYSTPNFNAHNRGYHPLMKHLQSMIYLIRKPSRTLCEQVNLLSPLLLCIVDKKAFKSPTLNQPYQVQYGFFSHSRYKNNKHWVIRDTLISLWTLANLPVNAPIKNNYLTRLQTHCFSIINFYIKHLTQEFMAHPLFATWVDQSTAQGQKELLHLVVQIINNELLSSTPSDYYSAPLCGVSLFCSALDHRGTLALELDDQGTASLKFTGSLSQTGVLSRQNIEPILILNKHLLETKHTRFNKISTM